MFGGRLPGTIWDSLHAMSPQHYGHGDTNIGGYWGSCVWIPSKYYSLYNRQTDIQKSHTTEKHQQLTELRFYALLDTK